MQEYARKFQGKVDCVVGLDSRGFLFGPIMALELEVPFIPIRKKGKLPGECSVTSYDLEYGSATFELQKNAFEFCNKHDKKSRTMIVDDLLATGGTMKAACDLGAKYLDFVSSRSVKMKEFSFLSLYTF